MPPLVSVADRPLVRPLVPSSSHPPLAGGGIDDCESEKGKGRSKGKSEGDAISNWVTSVIEGINASSLSQNLKNKFIYATIKCSKDERDAEALESATIADALKLQRRVSDHLEVPFDTLGKALGAIRFYVHQDPRAAPGLSSKLRSVTYAAAELKHYTAASRRTLFNDLNDVLTRIDPAEYRAHIASRAASSAEAPGDKHSDAEIPGEQENYAAKAENFTSSAKAPDGLCIQPPIAQGDVQAIPIRKGLPAVSRQQQTLPTVDLPPLHHIKVSECNHNAKAHEDIHQPLPSDISNSVWQWHVRTSPMRAELNASGSGLVSACAAGTVNSAASFDADSDAESETYEQHLHTLSKAQLKGILIEYKLPTSGNREQLIRRIIIEEDRLES